jgi:hypothetical protein
MEKSWVNWLTPIIPTTWEVEIGESDKDLVRTYLKKQVGHGSAYV